MPESAAAFSSESTDGDSPTFRPLDPLVVNPGRLSILLALAGSGPAGVEFVPLRRQTRLTDGNLASHARRLAAGGLVDIAKQFRAGKPVTTYLLTPAGRQALRSHVSAVIGPVDVVANSSGGRPGRTPLLGVVAATSPAAADSEDDWVD